MYRNFTTYPSLATPSRLTCKLMFMFMFDWTAWPSEGAGACFTFNIACHSDNDDLLLI